MKLRIKIPELVNTIDIKNAIITFNNNQRTGYIHYKNGDGVAMLAMLGDNLYGFIYLFRPSHRPTFVTPTPEASVAAAIKSATQSNMKDRPVEYAETWSEMMES